MAFIPPSAFRRFSLPFEDKYPEYLLHQSSVLCHNDSGLHSGPLSEKVELHILLPVFWLHGWAPAEKCSGLLLLFRNAELAGETALLLVLLINSLGVDLMSKSGLGISMISSVPLIFNNVFPIISFGTWNYIFQTLLVITLMILKRSFCPGYLFSFVVGIGFGKWSTFTTSGFRHCQTHCHWMCFTLSQDFSWCASVSVWPTTVCFRLFLQIFFHGTCLKSWKRNINWSKLALIWAVWRQQLFCHW